jgi:hypothetical protein
MADTSRKGIPVVFSGLLQLRIRSDPPEYTPHVAEPFQVGSFSESSNPVMQSMTCLGTDSRLQADDHPVACEISEILQEQLHRSPQADLRGVRVAIDDGIIRLRGWVASFHAKQLAHIIIRDQYHACRVENAIDVA